MSAHEVKIGLAAPRGGGKTTLITTLLEQTKPMLAGLPVSIEPADRQTEMNVADCSNQLAGALHAGGFDHMALATTNDVSRFNLQLVAGKTTIQLKIMDFPGGWIAAETRLPQFQQDWREVKEHIEGSIALLVPVDATVIMEAASPRQHHELPTMLRIAEVTSIVRAWAKGRVVAKEDGLLILVPLKCETYFTDNGGGRRDQSVQLLHAVEKLYADLQRTVAEEAHNATSRFTIRYHPVDTIGCVQLKSARWHTEPSSNALQFEAHYAIQGEPTLRRKGADGVMIELVSFLLRNAQAKQRQQDWFGQFWLWLTGESQQLRDALEMLAKRPFNGRVQSPKPVILPAKSPVQS